MASSPAPQNIREADSPGTASNGSNDDSSIYEDVSFEYNEDAEGNFIRISKGKPGRITTSSSPPTPYDSPLSGRDSYPPTKIILGATTESDLISLNSPVRRLSLTRSESAYSALSAPNADRDLERDSAPQRSFQRAASGPTIAISNTAASSHQLSAISISGPPKRLYPRRTTEDLLDQRQKRTTDDQRARLMSSEREQQLTYPDEKENMARGQNHVPSVEEIYGTGSAVRSSASSIAPSRIVPPLRLSHQQTGSAAVPARLRQLPSSAALNGRSNRLLKGSGVKHAFDKISEADSLEDDRNHGVHFDANPGEDTDPGEDEPPIAEYNVLSSSQSGATRPRRSASLSDALGADEHYQAGQGRLQGQARPTSRPGTSLGINREASGTSSRRAQIDDRQEGWKDHKRYQEPERSQPEREHHYASQARQSPSPTHIPTHVMNRASYQGHKRRDSDTLKNAQYVSYSNGSPTAVDIPPPSKASSSSISANNVKHRRSPTAPEPPTTSDVLQHGAPSAPNGKTWAPGDREEGDRERERERRPKSQSASPSEPPPSRPQQMQAVQSQSSGVKDRTLLVRCFSFISPSRVSKVIFCEG
ncbi:hypothetical protein BDZ89DRAFT_658844 [Hymenopellis radicata]|nr:hypothetical protein BDZ89DRAFT_658844 [Hymenopellis radicata]